MCQTILAAAPRDKLDQLYPPEFPEGGPPNLIKGPWADVMNDRPFHVPGAVCADILSSTPHAESKEGLGVYVYQLNATVHSIEDGRGLGAL